MQSLFFLSLFTLITARKREVTFTDDIVPQLGKRTDDRNFDHDIVLPVPFGHIDLDGYGDLPNGLKQPVDMLEFDMKNPDSEKEKRNYLMRKQLNNIGFYPDMSFRQPEIQSATDLPKHTPSNTGPEWIDFENILNYNIQHPPSKTAKLKPKHNLSKPDTQSEDKKDSKKKLNDQLDKTRFPSGSFDLYPKFRPGYENWTTCEQLKGDAKFNPKDLIGVTWIPFYAWAQGPHFVAYLHKFTFPTKKVNV